MRLHFPFDGEACLPACLLYVTSHKLRAVYIVLAGKVGQTLFKHVLHIVGLNSTNQHRLSLKVSDGGRRDSRLRKSPLDSIYRCYVGFNFAL